MAELFEVTKEYRERKNLTVRTFADEINQRLVNTNVSYGTVSRWEKDQSFYEPDPRLLLECMATYQDWRAEWARDCLRAMFPDLFESGVITVKLPWAE